MSDAFKVAHDDLLRPARKERAPAALRARVLGSPAPIPPSAQATPKGRVLAHSWRGLGGAGIAVAVVSLVGATWMATSSPEPQAEVKLHQTGSVAENAKTIRTLDSLSMVPEVEASAFALPSAPGIPAPSASSAAEDDSLGAEAALLTEAKHALATGRASDADAALRRYDGKFPRGMLKQEAQALRIEADLNLGRVQLARREFSAFETAHPTSPATTRLRRLLGDAGL